MRLCTANFQTYGEDLKAKGVLWLDEFAKYPDDLMETAIRACFGYCKKLPTIADIREAIKDLQYEEQVKPKQLAWDVKRSDDLHQKIMDMATGKTDTKEYLQKLNIDKQVEYAKSIFPDISAELVLRNLPEFMQGIEQQEKCFACRMQKQACNGWVIKHWLDKSGYVSNQMAKCEKNVK